MTIIATLIDPDDTVPRRAVGVGNDEAQAIKAVLDSAESFVDGPLVILLAEDIQRALAFASPDSFEMGAESTKWSVYIQAEDVGGPRRAQPRRHLHASPPPRYKSCLRLRSA